jgi:hypothetical protein
LKPSKNKLVNLIVNKVMIKYNHMTE